MFGSSTIGSLLPAYGRDYKNKSEVQRAFDADQDFVESVSGRYINKSQIKELGIKHVNVRYAKQRKITGVKVS